MTSTPPYSRRPGRRFFYVPPNPPYAASVKCPRCREPMQALKLGGTVARECSACGGLWLDPESLQKLSDSREERAGIVGMLAARVPTAGTPPEAGRGGAKRAAPGQLAAWAAALGGALRHRGTLSLILPPARLEEALEGCARAGCGSVRLFPLWPHPGEPARLLVLNAVRGGREALAVLPGLVLHRRGGGFTGEAEACLRGGIRLGVRVPLPTPQAEAEKKGGISSNP